MKCETYGFEEKKPYRYVVVFSQYQNKLLLSRHKERSTWETQGGHIEQGETPLEAARRELWEESGAKEFSLEPLCGYYAEDEVSGADGAVFVAYIEELGSLPYSEMAETALFEALPENLTYPGITPVLWQQAKEHIFPVRK